MPCIAGLPSRKFRALTTEEAFDHALKTFGADPRSYFAERLREDEPVKFFSRDWGLKANEAIACCVYFAVRSGLALALADEDAGAAEPRD